MLRRLGQPAPTLSGGVKLASELRKRSTGKFLVEILGAPAKAAKTAKGRRKTSA